MNTKAKTSGFSPDESEVNRNKEILNQALENNERELRFAIVSFLRKSNTRQISSQVDDIFQETAIEALRCPQNYNPDFSAKAWLRGIAFNVFRRRNRRRSLENKFLSPISETAQSFGFAKNTNETSETEMLDFLRQNDTANIFIASKLSADEILSLVNNDDREILRLRFVNGLSSREIAAHFGISEGTANVRLTRAKKRLQNEYLKQ